MNEISTPLQQAALARIRPDVRAMHAYVVQGADGMLKMDAMENPFALPPALQAQLGQRLGVVADGSFGEQELGLIGPCAFANAQALVDQVENALGRRATWISGAPEQPITRLAWCTGGAQGFFEAALAAGAQAFVTGEISEPQAHLAREMGATFIAAGHHATERYGIAALGEHVAQTLGLSHRFIEIANPA